MERNAGLDIVRSTAILLVRRGEHTCTKTL